MLLIKPYLGKTVRRDGDDASRALVYDEVRTHMLQVVELSDKKFSKMGKNYGN